MSNFVPRLNRSFFNEERNMRTRTRGWVFDDNGKAERFDTLECEGASDQSR